MKYSKMKKTMAVIGIAALLACPNGALTAMAETEDAQTEETETETETETGTKDESEDETSTDEPDTQKTSTENKKGEEDAVNEITADGGQKVSLSSNEGGNSNSEKTIQKAINLKFNTGDGTATFENPNSFYCGWCATLYKDGELAGEYGHYEGITSGEKCKIEGVGAGERPTIDFSRYFSGDGRYTFTVTLVEWAGSGNSPSATNWCVSDQSAPFVMGNSSGSDGSSSESSTPAQKATSLSWDEKTGIGSFTNPNNFSCGWFATLYKDGKSVGNYGGYYENESNYSANGVDAGETVDYIDLFNMLNGSGSYTFTVTLLDNRAGKDKCKAIVSDKSPAFAYETTKSLPTPEVKKVADGVVSCKLPADALVLHFGYQVRKGNNDIVKNFGGDHEISKKSNSETMDCINTPYGKISVDHRYDYYVRVRAMSSDLSQYSTSAYSDWVKILEATESFDDSNNSSSSSNEEASEPEPAPVYVPTTPEEKARYSVVGKETVKCTTTNSSYSVDVKNSLQGSKCFDSINAVLGDYTIGRTFNILPQGQYVYHTDTKARITLTIPQALQAAGRTYKMICVTEKGQPIELQDVDTSANTITFETDTYYAFALVYKDGAAN